MRRWYVVYTHPQAEPKAAFHLRQQGFALYLPQYLKRRSHARKVEWMPAPLFPRYLFLDIDLAETRWRAVLSTPGVAGLVSEGLGPAAVPEGVVEALQARHDGRGLIELEQPLRPGDRVRILDGPLSGMDGLFEQCDDRDRVTVLLDLIGRGTRVTLPARAVCAG
jgi:transcriptional antiterminator RfaH